MLAGSSFRAVSWPGLCSVPRRSSSSQPRVVRNVEKGMVRGGLERNRKGSEGIQRREPRMRGGHGEQKTSDNACPCRGLEVWERRATLSERGGKLTHIGYFGDVHLIDLNKNPQRGWELTSSFHRWSVFMSLNCTC